MMLKHKSQKHLPPLSKYARELCHDLVTPANACRFSKPSSDFKDDVTKAKATDCGQQAASSTQPPRPQALSPDVGCFVDSPSPRRDPAAAEARRYEGSLLDDVASPRGSRGGARSLPSPFDLDVDNILNLSPGGDGRARAPPCEERCRRPDAGSPLSAEGTCLDGRTMEEDGGYLSYHAEERAESQDPSASPPQQPRRASRSQLRLDCHAVGGKNLPESLGVQGPSPRQRPSFPVGGVEIMSGGPRPEPPRSRSPRKVLDGPVEELWNVGLPVLQSSLCHSPSVSSIEKASQAKCVSEGAMELLKEGGESQTSAGTDAESPLQVRVGESREAEQLCAPCGARAHATGGIHSILFLT